MKKVIRSAWEEDLSMYRDELVNEGVMNAWEAAFLNGDDSAYLDWDEEV